MKQYPIRRLKKGQSCILGPYRAAKTVSAMISKARKTLPDAKFAQKQLVALNPASLEAYRLYLVTRID